MNDELVRLDKAALRQMKRDARVVFPGVRHAQALEAMARGLGASSFNELREFAREFGAIRWCGDDTQAIRFLQARGVSVKSGSVARLVESHTIDHEAVPGFEAWSHASVSAPARND